MSHKVLTARQCTPYGAARMSIRTLSFDASYLTVREGAAFLSDALAWYRMRRRRANAAPSLTVALLRELGALARNGDSTYIRPDLLNAAQRIAALAVFNGPPSFQHRFHSLLETMHGTSSDTYPLRADKSPSSPSLDLTHLSAQIAAHRATQHYAHHGLAFDYFVASEKELPSSIAMSDSLFIASPHTLMVIGDRFDALPQASRATMIEYVAALGYGARISGDREYSIQLMGALAERDGRLDELMGVLTTLAPRHMASFIAPHMSAATPESKISLTTRVPAADERAHAFEWPAEVIVSYRPLALTWAASALPTRSVRHEALAGIFEHAALHVIRAHLHHPRQEAARALIRGENTASIRALMDRALDEATIELDRYAHAAALYFTRWLARIGAPRATHDTFQRQLGLHSAHEIDRADAAMEKLVNMKGATRRSSPLPEDATHRHIEQRRQLIARIATVIDDDAHYRAFCWAHIYPRWGWEPLERIVPERRALVELVRQHTLTLFGDPPASVHPFTGTARGGPPMDKGTTIFNKRFTPAQLKDHLVSLLSLTRAHDGTIVAASVPVSFWSDYERYIESVREWIPLVHIAPDAQPLVSIVRTQLCHRYGGTLPITSPEDGKHLHHNPLREFARAGALRVNHKYTAANFRDDCEVLLGLAFSPAAPSDDQTEAARTFKAAYERFVTHLLGWKLLEDSADYDRPLLACARDRVFELFGGWIPARMPIPPCTYFSQALAGQWIAHGGANLNRRTRSYLHTFFTQHLFTLARCAPHNYVRTTPDPAHLATADVWRAHYPETTVISALPAAIPPAISPAASALIRAVPR